MICKNCGNTASDAANFCKICGNKIERPIHPVSEEKLEYSAAEPAPKSKKKLFIILGAVGGGSILVFAVALILIIANIHTCDWCEESFFGSGHEYSPYYSDSDYRICNDCYDEIYNLWN